MIYRTKRLILRSINIDEAYLLHDYMQRNRVFLEQWEPKREDSFYTLENIKSIISTEIDDNANKKGLSLYIFKKDEDRIIGNIKLNNIVYGVFLSCFTGYKLDKDEQGNGYMTEALSEMVRIAFEKYKLHRIEANIMPRNKASKRVVEKMGFVNEGTSRKYLKINGKWEDHEHYVVLNEDMERYNS